jgi:ATP-binding protein involved in chromosome partitioning
MTEQDTALTVAAVREAIGAVVGLDGETSLAASGAIAGVTVAGDRASIVLEIKPQDAALWEPVRRAVEVRAKTVRGIATALVTLTAERTAQSPPAATPPAPKAASASPAPPSRFPRLAKVRRIIAVASGKGGVGKSTTAVNLALSFRASGLAVGFLDADVYGPSGPKLFGLKGQPRVLADRVLEPMTGHGCRVMSIGFLVDAEKAMIWRGPMVASAITQMLRDVDWGALDVLVVDMPPGTGDAQLTLAQSVPLDGAVIVSTPQDLALIDARRGVSMFRDVGVPILGLVENMSYFVCDGCGKEHHIFAHGGARADAERLGVPFLGEIPLDPLVRERADSGMPIIVTDPDSAIVGRYREMADAVWRALQRA